MFNLRGGKETEASERGRKGLREQTQAVTHRKIKAKNRKRETSKRGMSREVWWSPQKKTTSMTTGKENGGLPLDFGRMRAEEKSEKCRPNMATS